MTEKELQDRIARNLSEWFYVEKEVWSTDYKKRIDIAMIHKSDIQRQFPIGIEIKTFDKKTGSDAGKWLHQAQHYSEISFVNYGKMLIIVAPQFSGNVFLEGKLMHQHMINGDPSQDHNVATFLGQFNLGEFQRYDYEDYASHKTRRQSRIVYNGLIIWDEKRDTFRPKNMHRCKE